MSATPPQQPGTSGQLGSVAAIWCVILCAGAAAALGAAMTRDGVAVTPDSGHYLAAAHHVASGGAFQRLGREPMASWPPLYPATLAAIEVAGFDALAAARWLNLALLAATGILSYFWAVGRLRSPAGALAVSAAAVLGPPMMFVAGLALTDLSFVAFSSVALFATDAWLTRPTTARLLVCASAATLACLTRYPGAILVATIAGVMVWCGTASVRRRLIAAGTIVLAAGLPLSLWLIRNYALTGTFTGPRYASDSTLSGAALAVGQSVMSWFLPWRVLLTSPATGLVSLLTLLAILIVLGARAPERLRGTVSLCVAYVVLYLTSLTGSVATVQLDVVGDRMLAPIWVPLIMAFASGLAGLDALIGRTTWRPAVRLVVAVVAVVGASAVASARTASIVIDGWRHGPGGSAYSNFNTAEVRSSPTLAYARGHLQDAPLIFSSSPAAVYITTRLDSRPLPRKHARRSPSVRIDDLPTIRREVADAGVAYLVVLARHRPAHAYDLSALQGFFELTTSARFEDGEIIRLIPRTSGECLATPEGTVAAACESSGS